MSTFLVKIKKCSHEILSEKLFLIKRAYFYCYKCGKLILVKNLKMYESITEEKYEYNPIRIINQMLSNREKINNNKKGFISDIYINNRDIFIKYIKQYCLKLNYNKNIFYACLHLIDNYLIHALKKEISERNIALITLGFFLVTLKFNENDIFEPKLNKFYKISEDIVFSKNEIIKSEIKALKIMDYNMINYSVIDWLKTLNKVGYIFDNKFNKIKFEQIKDKQILLLRRIIHSNILYRYDSFQIALSIIHISMDNIFYTHKKNKDLYFFFLSIFSKKFSDYKSCYIDIKTFIFNDYNQGKKEDQKNSLSLNLKEKNERNSIKLKYLLNSMSASNKSKLKDNESNKVIFSLKKNLSNEDHKKFSIIDNFLLKLKKTDKKLLLSNNKSNKDLLFSFSSMSDKHFTIDCVKNNNDSNNNNNSNMSGFMNNRVKSGYINYNSQNKMQKKKNNNFRLNNDVILLLKKSSTSLSSNIYESKENVDRDKNNINLSGKNSEININNNILEKIGIKLKKEQEKGINFNNFMNNKGSSNFISNKNKLKNFILKKDGFINLKKGQKISISKDKNDNLMKKNKTLDIMKLNKTNNIFPKFNN